MLIGSRAIAHWNKDFKVKPGADWDIIGFTDDDDFFRAMLDIPDDGRIEVRDPTNPDETLLVKLYGWWVSYDGSNYSGWQFVTPRQKTITVYD